MSAMPTAAEYASHLPTTWRARVDPTPGSDWFHWRGHDVHLLRRRSEAPVRILLVHGAGGHSGALWPLASLVPPGVADLAAPDLPLYGRTRSPDPRAVRYDDWVDVLSALVEREDDGRPLVLLGASIGGMLAYEVAARTDRCAHVIATCLLDPRSTPVRAAITRFGSVAVPFSALASRIPDQAQGVRVPMAWVAPFARMSRDPSLSRRCARDVRGGAARVPLRFLTSYLSFAHTPGSQASTPLTLTAPAADAWTPLSLSQPWLEGIAAETRTVLLDGCGHFPVEEPGLTTFVETIVDVARSLT